MIIAYVDSNDCDFAVKFDNVNYVGQVKKAIKEGIGAWYEASYYEANRFDYDDDANEYFSVEELKSYYYSGYAEPTSDLLSKWGIEHEIVSVEFDEDGKVICDDIVR